MSDSRPHKRFVPKQQIFIFNEFRWFSSKNMIDDSTNRKTLSATNTEAEQGKPRVLKALDVKNILKQNLNAE